MSISDYRKKPNSSEYFKLAANNGRNYYFLNLETAEKAFEIYKNDAVRTDWTLFHVKENEQTILKFTTKRHNKSIDQNLITPKREKPRETLEEMLRHLAGEENDPPKRIN